MPTHTPRHPRSFRRLASGAVALAATLALATPAAAAPGDPTRVLDADRALARQAQQAAKQAGVKQKTTPPGKATDVTRALDAGLLAMVTDGAIGVTARVETPTFAWSGAAGLRDKDGAAPAGRQDRLRIASNTKTQIAVLVLQEVEKGTWRLDQPVREVLPGLFPAHPDVTFRQLLSHTSGAPNGTFELLLANMEDPTSFDDMVAAISRDYTAQEHIDAINAVPWTEPGQLYYSNAGYVALGMLLEAQNGRPVADLLRERIWKPAKLRHTSWADDPGLRGPVLNEDAWIGGWLELDGFDPDLFLASGAVVSTTADLSAFYEALFTGRLVDRALVDEMLVPASDSPYLEYGLGIYRLPDPCAAPGTAYLYGHDGATYGTLSMALSSPDGQRRLAVGVTGRDLENPLAPRWDFNDALVPMLLATC